MALTKVTRNLLSTGIDDQSTSTAITIDSSSNVGIGTTPAAGNTLDISSGDGTIRVTQELDVATAGLNLIGASNQGTLGRITIWQNATSAQGGYIRFDTCPTGTNTLTERMRILSSGGITFNGDTAAANALDDYEEGTWTPALGRSNIDPTVTYSAQLGSYTKIGRIVHVTGFLEWSANSGGSGSFEITALPFTIKTGNGNYPTMVSDDYFGVNFAAAGASFGGYGAVGNTFIRLINGLNNGGASQSISGLNSSGYIYFDMTYHT